MQSEYIYALCSKWIRDQQHKYMQSSLQQIFARKRISVAKFGWPKYEPNTCKTACNRFSPASEHPLQGSDGQNMIQTHAKHLATDFRLQANIRCKVRMTKLCTKYIQNSLQQIFARKRISVARFRKLRYDQNTRKQLATDFRTQANIRCKVRMAKI